MTVNVLKILEKIKDNPIFEQKLYFTGGTALSYYINHRISEDIDLVSTEPLQYKQIIPAIQTLGAKKIQDENVAALRMAGLFPDEYMIKFILDNVKLEFFQTNRPIQIKILKEATFTKFQESNLQILDIKSIAKLKLVALIQREKSRDLFDFGAIIDNEILSINEILDIFTEMNKNISDLKELTKFIQEKKEPKDDETVYLSETNKVHLSFKNIQKQVIKKLKMFVN